MTFLAAALGEDETAVICDLAETYHVLDYRALPVTTLAALVFGLREDSRIKMKMAGLEYVPPFLMLSVLADNTTIIRHGLFGNEKGQKPTLFGEMINKRGKLEAAKVDSFASGEDFLRAVGQI